MKTGNFLNAIILLMGVSLFAQDYDKWEDTNRDGFYDMNEFSTIYSKGYNDWDLDGDGKINNEEFYSNNYNKLDVNRDGRLTNEEWTAGKKEFEGFIPDDHDSQQEHLYVSKREFTNRFSTSEHYNSYDTNGDGFIDSEELTRTTFNRLDKNRDGKLDSTELAEYH